MKFKVEDHVLLKISPSRGIRIFGKKCKLEQRFVGPYKILDKIGALAY